MLVRNFFLLFLFDCCLDVYLTVFGIGTTGYAEVNEEITTPFAYYAIAFQGKIVNKGKIEVPNLTRIETQKKVAEHIIQQLHNFLKII